MLKFLHNFIFKNFKLSGFLLLLILGLCFWQIKSTKFRESAADILPVSDSLITEHETALEKFGQSTCLYFSLFYKENSDEDPAQLAQKFSEKLKFLPEFKAQTASEKELDIDESISIVLDYFPFIFDKETATELSKQITPEAIDLRFKEMKQQIIENGALAFPQLLTKDPLGILKIMQRKLEAATGKSLGKMRSGAVISADGKSALLIANFNFNAKDTQKSTQLIEKIETLINAFKAEETNAEIIYAGAYKISADNTKMVKADSPFCLGISFILMLLICLLAFSRKLYALLAIMPSMLGTLFAFTFMGLCFKDVSGISIAFASIAIGVTIDYAIHFIFHANTKNTNDISILTKTASVLAKPTTIGASTTIIAFVIMLFSGSVGFFQLGVFGAVGVAVSAFLSLLILPPILAKLKYIAPRQTVFDLLAKKIYEFNKASIFFSIALFLTILSFIFIWNLKFDGKISSFSGLYEKTKSDSAAIRKTWADAVSKTMAIAYSSDFEEALKIYAKLESDLKNNASISNLISFSKLLPSAEIRAENLKLYKDFFEANPQIETLIENSAKAYGFKPKLFKNSIKKSETISFEEAFENLKKGPFAAGFSRLFHQDESGTYIGNLFNVSANTDKFMLRKEIGGESQNIILADNELFENHISGLAKAWMIKFLFLAIFLVSVYLALTFKNLKHLVTVMLPVLTGLFWTFGAMAALGINVTLVNAIFVIFAVCIAEDYAVFIIFERFRGKRKDALQSVIVAALTTIVGFGALALAKHPILFGLGATAAISVLSILLASILISLPLSKNIKAKHGN